MTENKRFFLLEYKNNVIYDSEKDKEYSVQFKKQKQSLCVLLNEQEETIQELKKYISRVLFVLGCSKLPENTRLSDEEIEAISKLQNFIDEKIVDLEKKCNY